MARPLLSILLMLLAVFGLVAAVGMATGAFDLGQILTSALGQTVHGLVDAAVGGLKSFLSDVVSSSVPW
ncbi:hypothetical protein J2754_001081 [Halarchaeum solikamskense]|uniref:hypothetical protein n=1 Tax=Halarchaeum nitratireducens TaxID=489913 RepID=UPI001B3AB76A|nr:hypothetical protein [Halarchaeum solikamskense]MBP2250764.1 hypothetical protein [Halarchaeum solikamskense]